MEHGLYSNPSSGYTASCDLVPPTISAVQERSRGVYFDWMVTCGECGNKSVRAKCKKLEDYALISDDHYSVGSYSSSWVELGTKKEASGEWQSGNELFWGPYSCRTEYGAGYNHCSVCDLGILVSFSSIPQSMDIKLFVRDGAGNESTWTGQAWPPQGYFGS